MHVEKCETAKEVWNTLKKMFEDKGTTRKVALLRSLIQSRLDEHANMQEYIDKIVSTSRKLCGIGFDITDEWMGAILLSGLTDEYKPFIMSIEANGTDISGDTIISKLIDSQPSTSSGEAFFAKKWKKNFKGKDKVRKCYNCGSPSHLANACDKKKKVDTNDKKKNANAKKNEETAFMARESDFVKSDSGGKENQENGESVGLLSTANKDDWYVDSGATSHMSSNVDYMVNKRDSSTPSIATANNEKLSVKAVGDCKLNINDMTIKVKN